MAFPKVVGSVIRMTSHPSVLARMSADTKPADRGPAALAAVLAQVIAASRIDDLAEVKRRLRLILRMGHDVALGVPVSVSARLLDVSQPTVRAWIGRGLLETIPEKTPTRVSADSLGEVLAAIAEIRSSNEQGPLAGRVLQVLHDRRDRAELDDRAEELDRGAWTSVDFDDLDELFA